MATVTIRVGPRGNRKMLYLVEQYKRAHPDEGPEVSPHLVSAWAIRKGLWVRPPIDPGEILRRQLSRALRNTYVRDPQGREVRANHPVPKEVMTVDGPKTYRDWYPIFDTPPHMMRVSLGLRRKAALADAIQLKFDYESYNDNNHFGVQLEPLDLNFNRDIEELAMPTTYPEGPDDEDDEDDF